MQRARLERLVGVAQAHATILLQRLELGPGLRHMPDSEGFELDHRIASGDLPAIADAMVEAADALREVADAYYQAAGDGGVTARLRPLQERNDARRCRRD